MVLDIKYFNPSVNVVCDEPHVLIGGFGKRIINWVKSKAFTNAMKRKINRALSTWHRVDPKVPITNIKNTGKLNSHRLVENFLQYLFYISMVLLVHIFTHRI